VTFLDEPRHVAGHFWPHLHERRERIFPPSELREHRAHVRPVAAEITPHAIRQTGEQMMRRRRVIDIAVRHRADDGQLVAPLREQRKMLADLNARHVRADRLELAPNFRWRIWLEVPRFLLRRPAPHKKQNHRFGLHRRRGLFAREIFRCQQLRQRQAQQSRCAGRDEIATT